MLFIMLFVTLKYSLFFFPCFFSFKAFRRLSYLAQLSKTLRFNWESIMVYSLNGCNSESFFGEEKGATCTNKYYLILINPVHIIDTHKQKLKNRENIF